MKNDKSTLIPSESLTKSDNEFPVVGIGASAGGLDAFKRLLKAIPEESGMAFVLVQHLDPKHTSLLPELLQKVTNVPVSEITDDIKVLPNHIYILPSNKIMLATDGVLKLAPRPEANQNVRNLPIDLFFTSLAEVHQSHSIGVVLSGTGSDGTNGLIAIKNQGGITFAQDEASATYNGMPLSSVQSGVVDFILPPEEIPQKLLEITNIINGNKSNESQFSLIKANEDVFKQILALLRIRKGTDFAYYKQTTIQRRIRRRMALCKIEEPSIYLKFLIENKEEQDTLFQDFLIPVTEFFRDNKSFDNLCETIFPQIIKNKPNNEPIRIWIAGCSTGEEAYSMAMCIKKFIGEQSHTTIQIFATDISEIAINKARAGIYKKSEVENLSTQQLSEFFIKVNGQYQVKKKIRDMCVFALQNFLKDPPFGKMDLISCRNVLIYMEPYLQNKALTTFHYALNLKGFLLLGKTETISSVPNLFALAIKGDKIFSRKDVPSKFLHVSTQGNNQKLQNNTENSKADTISTDFQKAADDVIRSKYTPSGVIVNEVFDIVNFRGKTNDYLEQLDGKPSHNLLMLAKQGLAFELRNILHKAKNEKTTIIKENISLQDGVDKRIISIEAIPLNTIEPHYLILFHETPIPKSKTNKTLPNLKKNEKELRILNLEQELLQTHEDMRFITEEQEAANEELQSSNEELLSSSEELQSLNEELETSKEELQSTNEELMVINQEVINLNEQVTEAKNYAQSIVATIHDPLIILDKNLRVKSASKAFYKKFAVDEKDTEGMLLYDLGNKQWNIPSLREFLQDILPQKNEFHDFEVTHNFPDIGEKIMLLNAARLVQNNKNDELIMLSIKDVSEEALARKKVEESEKLFHNLIYSSPSAIGILKGVDLIITTANEPIIKIWGKGKEIIGKKYFEALPELAEQGYREIFAQVYKTGVPFNAIETPVRILQKEVFTLKYYNFLLYPQRNVNNEIDGIGIIATEVTVQAEFNNKIKESEKNFRQLADLMPEKVSNANAQGNVTYYNQKWLDYTGKSLVELKESGWEKIIDPDELDNNNKLWQQALETGTSLVSEERLLNKEGVYRWHLSRVSPVKDEDGKITKWIGITTDIHDQKLKEEKKDEFISIASHEMKTPLTTAKAYMQMLELSLDKTDENALFYAEKASQSINRLNELISELLDVSKIHLGKLNYNITSFDFNDMIENTVEYIQLTSPIQTIIKSGKVVGEVVGDKERLSQVVINLLTNAVKYSPNSGTIRINISQENESIKVSIKDSGMGIPKESLNKIFEKYYRIETKSGHIQGLGIGLYISYEIIQRHHGKIWVESEEGKGSTFYFKIPINKNELNNKLKS